MTIFVCLLKSETLNPFATTSNLPFNCDSLQLSLKTEKKAQNILSFPGNHDQANARHRKWLISMPCRCCQNCYERLHEEKQKPDCSFIICDNSIFSSFLPFVVASASAVVLHSRIFIIISRTSYPSV